MPAPRGRRGRRAARAGVGGNARRVARGPGDGAAARARGASAAPAPARALRRRDRRLPGPLRPAGGETRGAGCAGALQPARLARGHARLRSRALPAPARLRRARSSLVDRRALRAADVVVADTEQHARFLAELADLERVEVCFVGAEERLFRPGPDGRVHARALRRQADPAARPGDDPRGGAARARAPVPRRRQRPARRDCSSERPANVEWVPWVEYEQLAGELHAAGAALGIFGRSDKAARVIPNKAFQALACGTPLVTADTPAARELLVDGESALLVPPGDASGARRRAPTARVRRRLASAHRRGRAGRVPPARERRRPRAALALDPRARALSRALALAVSAFAAGFGALAVLRHRSFETGRFDLGNMTQAVWSTAHGDPLAVTNLAGEQTTRLASHFDPILVALRAALARLAEPRAACSSRRRSRSRSARCPSIWLARKHLDSERAGLGFALAYLLFPATQWVALSEFHPVALACPLLLFAFWFLDEDRLVPFAICAALAVHDEGGDPAGGRRARPLVRARAQAARRGDRDRRRRSSGRGVRARRRRSTSTTAAARSPDATTRSAARRPGS